VRQPVPCRIGHIVISDGDGRHGRSELGEYRRHHVDPVRLGGGTSASCRRGLRTTAERIR
jgi:hypothetical protein